MPGTVRETILQNELDRIRNTYSFRLGLLITDSLFRRPWLIIILPFLFIKMNLDFIRDRRMLKSKGGESNNDLVNNCIMLITASEEGFSASERAISITNSWLEEKDRKVVIVSTNENLTSMTIQGVSHYQIPDPKIHRDISTTEWNETCANVIKGAIETHYPFAVIFDGKYPYRGVLNALSLSKGQNRIWIHDEDVDSELINRGRTVFDKIVDRNEFNNRDEELYDHDIQENREISNKILIATGYDIHQNRDKMNKTIDARFNADLQHKFVFPNNADFGNIQQSNVIYWKTIGGQKELSSLKAAIICDDVDLATTCCNLGIPTIVLTNNKTSKDVKVSLNKIADLGNLFITQEDNQTELNLYLNAILDDKWSNEIQQRKPIIFNSKWNELFELCTS